MRYHKIKRTNIAVSEIGLGTWVLGGDAWGTSTEEEGREAVGTALDKGINFIDTAPIYGAGRSERIVGQAIKNKREQVVLATKCGIGMEGGRVVIDLSARSIRREIEESLRRLQVDDIDLYQCHWPDPHTPIEWTMEALNELKKEGKIKSIGVCNFPLSLLQQAQKVAEIVTLQTQYSLLERSMERDLFMYCRQENIGVIPYGVLGGGILTGKYATAPDFDSSDARNFFYPFYAGEKFERVKKMMGRLKPYSHPVHQTAINWVRQKEGVLTTLVGCRSPQQVIDNLQSLQWQLSSEEMKEIDQLHIG